MTISPVLDHIRTAVNSIEDAFVFVWERRLLLCLLHWYIYVRCRHDHLLILTLNLSLIYYRRMHLLEFPLRFLKLLVQNPMHPCHLWGFDTISIIFRDLGFADRFSLSRGVPG